VAGDLDLGTPRQGVDHRDADTVEAAGHRVGPLLELAAGVERGEDRGQGRQLGLGVLVDGDAAAVVLDPDAPVAEEGDLDPAAVARHRFVDGVVHDLPDQVVEALGSGRSDVHGGAAADRLEALEDGDVLGSVRRGGSTVGVGHRSPPGRADRPAGTR
jgi:hypothetical protein